MMVKAKSQEHKPDDKEQSKLFIKTAREFGADKEKSAADELIGRLAKMLPQPQGKAHSKKTGH